MATQYSYSIHQKRHELLSQLVTKLLHVEPDDENYSLALDFCLQKAYYHSFLDPNPRETESLIADVVARLEADSQLTKSAALTALTSKLLAVKLHSTADVQDLNHNLLHLLISLSNQPLSSSLDLTPDVLDLLYQPASTARTQTQQEQSQQPTDRQTQPAGAGHFQQLLRRAAGRAAQHSDADSAGSCDEFDPYGDTSSLSDWEDSEGPRQQQQQPPQQAAEAGNGTEHQPEQQAANVEQQAQPAPSKQGADSDGMPAAPARNLHLMQRPHGCVVPTLSQPLTKLTALRPQQLVALSLFEKQQQLCLSEHFLAQQVLRVLQGLPGEGFVIKDHRDEAAPSSSQQESIDPATSSSGKGAGSSGRLAWSSKQHFEVHPGVSTPHCLPGSLRALLADAAAAGTCARQLRALIQQLVFGDVVTDMVGNSVRVTPCLRALGVALQQQLDWLGLQIVNLQEQLPQETQRNSSSSSGQQGHDHGRGMALQVFMHEARPVLRRLHLLHSTVFGLVQELEGPPAEVSAALIDGLAAAVRGAYDAATTGPQGVANAAALLHLLLSSAVPLSRALAQWLWCAADGISEVSSTQQASDDSAGGAQQNQQQQRAGVNVCSKDFFILKTASSDMSAVHPSFWHAAYSFSQQQPAAAAAAAAAATNNDFVAAAEVYCPAVLAPYAHSIMTAGKSMRLLDHMNQEELKHSNLYSVDSAANSKQPAAAGTVLGSAAAAAGRHPVQQAAAGTLQRRPSTPRQRRPSSAGGRAAVGGPAAGRLSRRPSLSGLPASQLATESCAAAGTRPGTADRQVGSRKKWAAGPALQGLAGLPAAAVQPGGRGVPRCVQAQLAAAAVVAGKQAQEELPAEFISTACYVLQQEQRLQVQAQGQLQQHQQYLQDGCSDLPGTAAGAAAATKAMLVQRLEAVASALAHPVDLQAAPTATHDPGQQDGQVSLRGALAAARKARMSSAALLDGEQQHTERPQQHAVEGGDAAVGVPLAEAAAAPTEACVLHTDPGCWSAAAAEPGALHTKPACMPSAAATADAVASSNDADSSSDVAAAPPTAQAGMSAAETAAEHDVLACLSTAAAAAAAAEDGGSNVQAATAEVAAGDSVCVGSPDVVPRLTVWRDQMQERLTAAGQQLQQMAPRRPQQHDSSTAVTAHDCTQPKDSDGSRRPDSSKPSSKASSRNWLLQSADTKAPSHFTGSLAELWPLQPIVGFREAAAGGSSSGSWLRGAAWPGSELAWLLQDPPQHLPDVQQLLSSALVQPVIARVELVDRQLMSSLMGEWGMLQQLQGLANTFLIASPAMVEWVDALFTAVECTAPPRDRSGGDGLSTPTTASRTMPRTSALAAGLGSGSPGLIGSPRGGAGAAAAASASGVPVRVGHLEVTSLAALLQDYIASADPDEVLPDPEFLILSVNSEAMANLHKLQEQRKKPQQPGVEPMPTGLMLSSREWVGLDLHHAGSWQLSLVYTDEQLRFFSQVWRQMLQLRWARRRVGAQMTAHKSSAHINSHAIRDLIESAAAEAADAAMKQGKQWRSRAPEFGSSLGSSSFGQHRGQAGSADADEKLLDWLSGKQELLLLQEMWHFLSCWHSYVMDGMRVRAWEQLEKVLLSAKSLDQVHKATKAFFEALCSFCNLVPQPSSSKKYQGRSGMRQMMEGLMDHALAAAAAAEREHTARQKLVELQAASKSEAHMQPWWVELARARTALRQAGDRWHAVLKNLLSAWAIMKQAKWGHALAELQDVLDMNGFFSRLRTEPPK